MYTVALAKLENRKRFHDILDQLVKLNKRQTIPFVLMFIDLDKFKMINDTLGHNVGDELLQQVSARLGGDEFAIILPGVEDAANAEIVARKLLSVIATPFMLAGSAHEIGMSIGVALFPQHGENETDIVHHADLAMYFAKKNKTGYRIYDETLLSYAKS